MEDGEPGQIPVSGRASMFSTITPIGIPELDVVGEYKTAGRQTEDIIESEEQHSLE